MSLNVTCPNPKCGKSYPVSAEYLGRRGRCKSCGTEFVFAATTSSGDRSDSQHRSADQPAGSKSGTSPGSVRSSRSQIPSRLGRFQILERVGMGGFGAVYRAQDPQLQRTVALKLLQSTGDEQRDRHRIDRFLVEGRAGARLQHPNIVPVFDAGKDEETGEYYMAAAFIMGQPLSAVIDGKPLDLKRAVTIVVQLARALEYAHTQGILHRDVKPDNVMLDEKDVPHLMDFGLARMEESESHLTRDGAVMGTPSYMSPEQCVGKQEALGPAADQYSLGCLLYELLTGEKLFDGPVSVQIHHQINTEAPPPSKKNAAIPQDLDTICLKTLAKEPDRRYASCAAFAADLEHWLADEPIQARQLTTWERWNRWLKKNPMAAAAYGLSAITVVLFAIGITIFVFWRSAESARSDAVNARHQTENALHGEQEARAGEEAARKELEETKAYSQYVLNVRLAPMQWDKGWVTSARQALEECPPQHRGWEWQYLNRKLHPEAARMQGNGTQMFLNADGQLLVSAGKSLVIWDAETGYEDARLSDLSAIRTVTINPDHSRIAAGSDSTSSQIMVWDFPQGRRLADIPVSSGVVSIAFSLDGSRLAAGLRDSSLKMWNAADFTEIPVNARHTNGVAQLAFLTSGDRLASGCWNGFLHLWRPVDGTLQLTVDTHEVHGQSQRSMLGADNMIALIAGRNGRELLTVTRDGTVKCWDTTTLDELASWKEDLEVASVAVSPDHTRMVLTGKPETQIKIRDLRTGQVLVACAAIDGFPNCAKCSPDNRHLATGWFDGLIRLWDLQTGNLLATYTGHANAVTHLNFSPDGTKLYSRDQSDIFLGWNLHTHDDVVEFRTPTENPVADISNDGIWGAFVLPNQSVRVRRLSDGLELTILENVGQDIVQLAFHPGNRLLASLGKGGTIHLRDIHAEQKPIVLQRHVGRVNFLEFSPSGNWLATAGEDHLIKIWDVGTGAELMSLDSHTQPVKNLAFHPGGNLLASASLDHTVRVWDLSNGRVVFKQEWEFPHQNRLWPLRFSPDGTMLASATDNHARLWNLPDGMEIATLDAQNRIDELEFSPDSRIWLVSDWSFNTRLWKIPERRDLASFDGSLNSFRFSPDGRRLVAAQSDQTIRLWDTSSWQELAALTGHSLSPISLQFDVPGKTLLSISYDGTIRRWVADDSAGAAQERLRAWRLDELRNAEQMENWDAAAFHLGWLLKHQPEDVALKSRYEQAVARRDAQAQEHQTRFDSQAVRKSNAIIFAEERQAAEWVLSRGGTVGLVGPYGEAVAMVDGKLPDVPFVIRGVSFDRNCRLTSEDLLPLKLCRRLTSIAFYSTPFDGTGLEHLKSVRSLNALHLIGLDDGSQTNKLLTDQTLSSIAELTQLKTLQLASNQALTDACLATVGRLTDLEQLYLDQVPIGDAGLEHLQSLSKLKTVTTGTRVTNVGLQSLIAHHPNLKEIAVAHQPLTLEPLAAASHLEYAQVAGDQLTPQGAAVLAALPKFQSMQIIYPTPGSIAQLNLPLLKSLSIAFTSVSFSTPEAQAILKSTNLESLQLEGRAGSPDDETLLLLARLPKLKSFQLSFSDQTEPRRYTTAGIEKFRTLRPDVDLNVDGKAYSVVKPAN